MKTPRSRVYALTLLLSGLLLLPLHSRAYDIYLSMTGVTGSGPGGKIPINTFRWGLTRTISLAPGGGRSAATPVFTDITLTKDMDKSSPLIAFNAAGGSPTTCILTVADHNSGKTMYTLTLSNALISGYSISSGGERPSETFTLNYTAISWLYQELDGDGQTVGDPVGPYSWNLAQVPGS